MKKINWKDPKTKAVAAGAAGVVAFALYRSKHPSSPTPSSIQPGGGDPTGAANALGDANLQSAVYDSLESQLTGLAGVLGADQTELAAQKQLLAGQGTKITNLSALLTKTRQQLAVLQHKPSSPKPKPVPKPGPAKKVPVVANKHTPPKPAPTKGGKPAPPPTAAQNQQAALRYIHQTQVDQAAALRFIGANKKPAKK